jgi:hypothetical protein
VYRYKKNKQSTWPWIFENLQGLLPRNGLCRHEFIHELLCDGDVIFQIPYHNLAVQSCNHEARKSEYSSNAALEILEVSTTDFKPDVLNRLTILSLPFLKGTMQLGI